METIAKIRRLYHVDGKGFKTIARELNLSKNTVKKIIREDKTNSDYMRAEISYRVLGKYTERLVEKLKHDFHEPKRRKRTAKKIYEELQLEGYTGSYDAVHEFIAKWRRDRKQGISKAFVPLEFSPGEAFQFDWSTEEILLSGVLTRIKVAHIRLCYSRYFFMIGYPNEQMEMVFAAHNEAFKFFKGVCHKGIYDNMKTAVQTVLLGKEREFNPRFLQLCSHHLFEPIACTRASGWEKGQVENQVDTGRCNFFTPLVKVDSLLDLNKMLEASCLAWAQKTRHPEQKEKTTLEVYQEELPFLTPYRGDFDGYKVEKEVVSPYCFVHYATNAYSVECHYVGKGVDVYIYAEKIKIIYQGKCIGEHTRSFERYKRIYDPWHYVPILERKPGALRNGAPFKALNLPAAMQKVREKLAQYSDGDKQFVRVLLAVSVHGLNAVENACALALTQGGCNDTIIFRYLEPVLKPNKEQEYLTLLFPPTGDLQCYNRVCLSGKMLSMEVGHA